MLDNNERLLVLENSFHGVEKICTWLFAYCHMEFVVLGNAHALIYLLLFNLVQVIMTKLCLLITHAEWFLLFTKIPHGVDLQIVYVGRL